MRAYSIIQQIIKIKMKVKIKNKDHDINHF